MLRATVPTEDVRQAAENMLVKLDQIVHHPVEDLRLRFFGFSLVKATGELYERTFYRDGKEYMARNKRPNDRTFEWDWADIHFGPTDFSEFDAWLEAEGKKSSTHLAEMAEEGYKVTITFDPVMVMWRCQISGTQHTEVNQNMGLSSESGDMLDAISITYYKHYVFGDGGQWPKKTSKRRR